MTTWTSQLTAHPGDLMLETSIYDLIYTERIDSNFKALITKKKQLTI